MEAQALIRDALDAAGGTEMELAGLTEQATASLLETVLGVPPDPEFVRSSHSATGGSPFLITELARTMRDNGVTPSADEAPRAESLTPVSVVRRISVRMRRLPSHAQALAGALAVLGMEAQPRHAAALAGLDAESATDAADALLVARLVVSLAPLRFEHAVVRAAVLAGMAPGRLAREHLRAAQLLALAGAPADEVANHLLVTPPAGDEATATLLRDAGDLVVRRGTTGSAIKYFERALAEPPPAEERWPLLRRLGGAEARLGRPTAIEHLQAALDECPDPAQRPHIALELGDSLARTGRPQEAHTLLVRTLEKQPDHEEITRYLQAALITHGLLDNDLAQLVRPQVEALTDLLGSTPGERTVLAIVAYVKANDGSPFQLALDLGRRALGDGLGLPAGHSPLERISFGLLSRALTTFGDIDGARRIHSWIFADAEAQGSVETYTMGVIAQAALAYSVGDIRAAKEDADTALALAIDAGSLSTLPLSAGILAATALELDTGAEAMDVLGGLGLLGPMPEMGIFDVGLFFRGLLRGERDEVESGLADLFELGRRERVAGHHYPFTQWRVGAAPLLVKTGRRTEALALLEEELALARRRGAAGPLGAALRATGVIAGGERGLGLLRESLDLLDPTPFRLERARSEVELGAALRRRNHRADARAHLERGMELAFRCGALALTSRARDELVAAGARPRRMAVTGPDSLTASERRVAELAAAGRSNPEIAQALFVSRKTVETHLGRAYQKLSISNRSELGYALGPEGESGQSGKQP